MNARLEAKVLKLRMQQQPAKAKPTSSGWPIRQRITAPANPADTVLAMRAMSALYGIPMWDGGPPPVLPADQARDVLLWLRMPV